MSDQNTEELKRLARIGARQRLIEIDEERARLLALFPELAREARKPRGPIAKASEPLVLFDAQDVANDDEAHDEKTNGVRAHAMTDDEVKARVLELLREGKTVPEVSAAIGHSKHKSWLYRVASDAGVKPPRAPRGRVPKPSGEERPATKKAGKRTRRTFTDEEMREPLAQLKAGAYLADVSRTFDMGPTLLRRWADKHKIRITAMPIDERQSRVSAAKRALQREGGKHGHKGSRARDYRPARAPEQRAVVLKRLANGERISAIAKDMGIPKPTAIRWSKDNSGNAANEEG